MAKFVDYASGREVQDIMEKFLEKFPQIFEGFDTAKIGFVMTKKKKSKVPMKLVSVGYPVNVFLDKTYIVEVFEKFWKKLDDKKRNLSVFHTMCAIPDGAFDDQSNNYGKKLQPEIKMYLREYAAAGGVPNWMDNPAAADPLERSIEEMEEDVPIVEAIPDEDDGVERNPVTKKAVEAA